MILPRTVVVWALVLLPCAVAAPLSPALLLLFAALVGALLVCSVADMLLLYNVTSGVHIVFPPLTRLAMRRQGTITCEVRNAGGRPFRMVAVAVLPGELGADTTELQVAVPRAPSASFAYSCTPTRRGSYRVAVFHSEVISPLGLWARRMTWAPGAEVRVFPDLFSARRTVAAVFPARIAPGSHLQRMAGQGREFDKLRDYVHGDSLDIISWKATAKRARPISKVYQIERTQEVYVAIDASRLSGRQAGGDPVIEHYITAALTLGLAVQQQGDLFGLLTFDDQIRSFIRAGSGAAHFTACRTAVYTLQPQERYPDFAALFSFIRLNLRRRALIVFLTNLDDPGIADPFLEHIPLIRRQHLCVVVMSRTRHMAPLFTSPVASDLDVYRHLASHMRWTGLLGIQGKLGKLGVPCAAVDHQALAIDLITRYVGIKRRQLL